MHQLPQAAADRTINYFTQPYLLVESPYKQTDFHPDTVQACQSNKNLTSGPRVAKIIVVGDVAVGKTCLVNRFCREVFNAEYKATIGVDFEVERFDILNAPYNLQIWDTAGQERFKCIASAYYRGAHAIVVVFDLTNTWSLRNATVWLEEALGANTSPATNGCYSPTSPSVKYDLGEEDYPHIHTFLVGTKRDLCSEATYNSVESRAIKVARQMNAEYWPVSAKSGDNVVEFFSRLACLTFDSCLRREVAAGRSSGAKQVGDLVKLKKTSTRENINGRDGARRRLSVPRCSSGGGGGGSSSSRSSGGKGDACAS